MTIRISRARKPVGAHDRGGAGRVNEIAIPQIQHPLQDIPAGDDFGMMREVLTRRFSRLLKEEGEAGETCRVSWPGSGADRRRAGPAQCGARRAGRSGLSDLPVVGVAKGPDRDAGREHFYRPGKPSFMLEQRDPVLYYIQRLRDEAHRFAIGSHRARRAKAIGANRWTRSPA